MTDLKPTSPEERPDMDRIAERLGVQTYSRDFESYHLWQKRGLRVFTSTKLERDMWRELEKLQRVREAAQRAVTVTIAEECSHGGSRPSLCCECNFDQEERLGRALAALRAVLKETE